ncbi:hypothetical protein [Herbaspirillum sp. AP21]|uniref:hypothetical protein n=1 Tax=Herbaspirillum sp. AP21 TaxID=2754073 RepID=UPI0015DAAE73|nr:hypothetical protein [Herbaspirillum sp. AP21]NZD68171.1 hypothetical protein [Herbaspirillum sp. AP21]
MFQDAIFPECKKRGGSFPVPPRFFVWPLAIAAFAIAMIVMAMHIAVPRIRFF